ncbi:MAG: hypothetical protein FVQ85_05165 [Planctomycetes bacterium]|nr:hypothetical protein [Planctomycetota bacterium]
MSNSVNNNLSKPIVQKILLALGSKPIEVTKRIEATEYDWRQPHYFSINQLNKLDSFTQNVAHTCTENFTQLFHGDFDVTIVSITQHFANELIDPDNEQSYYYIAFGEIQENPFGLIAIPVQSAITWTTQVLGDTESKEDSNRELSQLEVSLLLDIVSALVEAFSKTYDNNNLKPAKNIVKDQMPIELQGTEELCKITFSVKKANSENSPEAYFLIFCENLKPIVEKNVQNSEDFSAQEISKTILDHLQKMLLSVTAQLASTVLTFEEVMSLGAGDILLLDKKIHEPVELIVEGRILFRGQPAKSSGKYAVVITELCSAQ